MQTRTLKKLSASVDGEPIKIAATATAGTLVHTATSSTNALVWDEIYMAFTNTSSSPVTITVEYGGATDPDNLICKTVTLPPLCAPQWLLEGFILQNGQTIRVFASTANVVLASGHIYEVA